jgi:hypothetical protein
MPSGSTDCAHGVCDSAFGQSPVPQPNGITVTPATTLKITATGGVSQDPSFPLVGPNGTSVIHSHDAGPTNGIADINAPISSLLGVFLDDNPPNLSQTPGPATDNSHPGLKQVFFIGSSATVTVPKGATRLFLGVMDSFNWANNPGSFTVNITSGCQANINPLLSQDNPIWANLPYAQGYIEPAGTIGNEGCALTDLVMVINSQAAQTGNLFATNPVDLNAYLEANHGYYQTSGGIVPGAVAQYARDNGVPLYYQGLSQAQLPDSQVDAYLCAGNPVLVQVGLRNEPHWVLATGQTTVGVTNTYNVIDPDGAFTRTLLNYPGQAQAGYFTLLYSSAMIPPSSFYLAAHSPVELMITDPQGRNTGIDVSTGNVIQQIPRSSYHTDAASYDHVVPRVPAEPAKVIEVLVPSSGQYPLTVTGTENGSYTIEYHAYDQTGHLSLATVAGIITRGTVVNYDVKYSPIPGVPLAVTKIVTFSSTFADINNALQLGLIDNAGIANSLSQQIQAAQTATGPASNNILNAFKSLVNAQSGKHITGIAPQVLLQDADSLISQNQ